MRSGAFPERPSDISKRRDRHHLREVESDFAEVGEDPIDLVTLGGNPVAVRGLRANVYPLALRKRRIADGEGLGERGVGPLNHQPVISNLFGDVKHGPIAATMDRERGAAPSSPVGSRQRGAEKVEAVGDALNRAASRQPLLPYAVVSPDRLL